MSNWLIYQGDGKFHTGITRLPPPPTWRTFDAVVNSPGPDLSHTDWTATDLTRGRSYRATTKMLNAINAALYLRRPLLVTGKPGVGKSTLAYSLAYELGLPPVLRWSITSSSVLKDGLYSYDAIGRLQDVDMKSSAIPTEIGRYLRLGPLGTALLASDTPRVLLIDEIDKADIDLPNDLLTTFEEGQYEVPELVRIADKFSEIRVKTADLHADDKDKGWTKLVNGQVQCRQFPIVVMTSNQERQFPPAFLRRCLRLDIDLPDAEQLRKIVEAQLDGAIVAEVRDLIDKFHVQSQEKDLATDQLFNAIVLTCRNDLEAREKEDLRRLLLRSLTDVG